MDILIHPFPSSEEEFYQRLAPRLNALITDSSDDSVNLATQSNSCTAKPSSPLQGSTKESSSKSQESAPLIVHETASHERTLAHKIDVKGKAPLHDQALLQDTLKKNSSDDSVNLATQSNSCTAKPSSPLQGSTKESSSKSQESAPLIVHETASHERTLAHKIDVKGKAPLHDQALLQDTLKKRNIIRKNQIKVRLPNGSVLFSEFKKDDNLSNVKDWVLAETRFSRVKISRSVPLKTFDDSDYSKSLEELKIFGNTLVAETEDDTPGFLTRVISILFLFFKGIYDAFLRLFDAPPEEIKTNKRVYNGNSTNLE